MKLKTMISRPAFRKLLLATLITGALAGCSQNNDDQVDISALLDRGQAYHDQGQYRASMIEAKNAIQSAPKNATGHILLAENLLELGSAKAASNQLEQLTVLGDDALTAQYYLLLGEAYLLQAKFQSASQSLLTATQKAPSVEQETKIYALLGQTYIGDGNLEESEKWFNKALEKDAANTDALVGLAQVSTLKKDIEATQRYTEQALSSSNNAPVALLWKGNQELAIGRFEAAIDLYTEALSKLPQTDIISHRKSTVLRQIIHTFTQMGKPDQALIYTRILEDSNPTGMELAGKFEEALEKFQNNELDESEALLLDIMQRAPDHNPSGILLGFIKYSKGDIEGAEQLLAKHVDPETASETA